MMILWDTTKRTSGEKVFPRPEADYTVGYLLTQDLGGNEILYVTEVQRVSETGETFLGSLPELLGALRMSEEALARVLHDAAMDDWVTADERRHEGF